MAKINQEIKAAFSVCKELGCTVAAWGKDSLVVEIKEPNLLHGLKNRLTPLGFNFYPDEDSQAAGLYDFNLSAATFLKKPNRFYGKQVIQLPFFARFYKLAYSTFFFVLAFNIIAITSSLSEQYLRVFRLTSLCFALALLFYSIQDISWKIEFAEDGLKINSLFSKNFILWSDINSVEKKMYNRDYEYLAFKLRSKKAINTPGMPKDEATELRDEIKRRIKEKTMAVSV